MTSLPVEGLHAWPDLAGRVRVHFVVGARGPVLSSAVEDSGLADETTAPCVSRAVQRCSAAQEARAGLGGRGAAGVLVFDCVGRGMILSKAFQSEIDAVRSVFDGAPITGFLGAPGFLGGERNQSSRRCLRCAPLGE